jgi:hypothetical protein
MGHNFGNKKLKVYKNDLEKFIVDHAGAYYKVSPVLRDCSSLSRESNCLMLAC